MTDLILRSDAAREMWKHANGKTVLGGQTYQSLTLEVALDAIAALPAVTVGVKPLVWFEVERGQNGYGKWTAEGYTVRKIEGMFLLDFAGDGKSFWRFPDADAAKAAAQADYEQRILAALEPVAATLAKEEQK